MARTPQAETLTRGAAASRRAGHPSTGYGRRVGIARLAQVADAELLARTRDEAARWQLAGGVRQWQPGEVSAEQIRRELARREWHILCAGSGIAALRLLWS